MTVGRCLNYCQDAIVVACVFVCLQLTPAQTPERNTTQDRPDVLVVNTEVVQTDVMVFDKEGRYVNGLKREDFELRVDGKPKPVQFFERIQTGSVNEEQQIAAARGRARTTLNDGGAPGPRPLDRGRPVYFYIDDLHMDVAGLNDTRKLILTFINTHMRQNDEVAIAAASGQLGFLSQLTDNKTVLRAAVERLKLRPYSVRDFQTPHMTEHQALLISNHDRDVTDFFAEALIRENPLLSREQAEQMVRSRASIIVRQAANVTTNTVAGLEGLVRSSSEIAGRKLVFFISQGFFLDDQNSDTRDRLRRITSTAARSGVVIYSIDARGLSVGGINAAMDSVVDPSGRLALAAGQALSASQDGMNTLAVDTGGRAFFNSNALETAVQRGVEETSNYYLLAWKPDSESSRSNKFRRIEVKIVGRPQLTVQVRRGFFDLPSEPEITKAPPTTTPANNVAEELRKALRSPYPKVQIPLSLHLRYVNTRDKGDLLYATIQVPTQVLSFTPLEGKYTAVVDVLGVIYNTNGEPGASFNKKVTISTKNVEAIQGNESVMYNFPVYLKPGLYQTRVAARDERTGRTGTAHEWIEVPDTNTGQLALSSILIGARSQFPIGSGPANSPSDAETELRPGNRFSQNDSLRFVVVIYNATSAPGGTPDVAVQVQVVRDDQPVVTAPSKKVSLEGADDLKRIPYAAELPLAGLPAGRYLIQVSIVDRISKNSATRQARFNIE